MKTQRTQKRTQTRAQSPGFLRPSERTVFRDSESLAKKITGLPNGPWSANSPRDERRFSVAYRLSRAMSPSFRDSLLKELR